MPRVVRLGRPANDNARQSRPLLRVLLAVLASALAVVVALNWSLI